MNDIKTKIIPFSTTEMVEFFENPDEFFYLDYNASKLKKDMFVTYLANMKIKCDLINYQSMPYEDKKELLSAFFEHMYLVDVGVLRDALVSVLMYLRTEKNLFDFFTEEEMKSFILDEKESLNVISNFFDSMLLIIPTIATEFKETVFDKLIENNEIEVVMDAAAIGLNVFGLIDYPNFIDMFIGSATEEPVIRYYKKPIENFLYKNQKFAELILNSKTPSFLISVFNLLSSTDELETNYFEALKKGA
jgi:hypothetical protein